MKILNSKGLTVLFCYAIIISSSRKDYIKVDSFEKNALKPSYTRLWISLAVSLILGVGSLIFGLINNYNTIGTIILSVLILTFSCSLFYEDSAVRDVIVWMAERSIRFPGLIWEFSFDGFMWLIGMKILFAVVGFLFGIICAIIGVILGLFISPFTLPFSIYEYAHDQRG